MPGDARGGESRVMEAWEWCAADDGKEQLFVETVMDDESLEYFGLVSVCVYLLTQMNWNYRWA